MGRRSYCDRLLRFNSLLLSGLLELAHVEPWRHLNCCLDNLVLGLRQLVDGPIWHLALILLHLLGSVKVKVNLAAPSRVLTVALFVWAVDRELDIDWGKLLGMYLRALWDVDLPVQFGHFRQFPLRDLIDLKIIVDPIVPLGQLLALLCGLILQSCRMHPRLSFTLIPFHHVIFVFLRLLFSLFQHFNFVAAGRLCNELLPGCCLLIYLWQSPRRGHLSWRRYHLLPTLACPILFGLFQEVGFRRLGQPADVCCAIG